MSPAQNSTVQPVPRVAVIGCGYWGQNLVRVFHSLGALQLICDPLPEGRQTAAEIAPDIPLIDHFDDVLKRSDVDAVVIATPAMTHSQLTTKALFAGKHVFVEKPLAMSLEEGEEIVNLAESHRKIVMVGHILSYHPAVTQLKRFIDTGELGKILYINSHRLNFGKIRREENILWSFAPHDISTILMLLHENPTELTCSGGEYIQSGIYDLTLTSLEFASGVKAHIFVSWMHPFKEQKLVVIGDKKMAVFDDTSAEKLVIYPHTIEWHHRAAVTHKMDRQVIEIDSTEPLVAEALHFLDCIRSAHQPLTDAAEGLRVLRILSASEESLKRNGAAVRIGGPDQREHSWFAHSSSLIDTGVQIGEGTKIWHFSHILSNSNIGKQCVISQNVMIGPDVTIGDNVKIQNNVSVYKGVTLESDVFCGPSVVFTNVINPRSAIPRKSEFRHTLVRKGASLGANATILAGVTIGQFAFVGAGAVVTKNVPDYALVIGNPARLQGWMCECGIKLHFTNNSSRCENCHKNFRLTDQDTVEELT